MGPTHVVEYISFSLFLLIPIFNFWGPNGLLLGSGLGLKTVLGCTHISKQLEYCSISDLSCSFEFVWVVGGSGGVPSDYFVSTQLQLLLFCCWGCGCCWAVTICIRIMK